MHSLPVAMFEQVNDCMMLHHPKVSTQQQPVTGPEEEGCEQKSLKQTVTADRYSRQDEKEKVCNVLTGHIAN